MSEALVTVPPDELDELERSSRVVRWLVGAERALSSLALVATFSLVLLQVVSRYVFHSPLTWTEELARFSLVWLAFLGAGFVMARRQHIAVDILAKALGKVGERIVNGIAIVVVLIVSGVLAVAGAQFAVLASAIKAPATQLPMSVVYGAAAVGFALIFIHGVLNSGFDMAQARKRSTVAAGPEGVSE
ncbi:TRAP transporter small permease [Leucobacter aridicollis]|uniref:TRAP transporter small permease n=1 Tax=Leucobacter aridicollis TaxID=283878 RepID=UPI00163DC734|nr:TRAP transporter small permease [Leucobacter aridicollis]MBL3680786.1 TRAP transporter small permease [Leucobacter aridicollis]